ncbi:MAG: EamA family transporter [Firmicutes bacterium]|nr:EamA family transporter [Bacillota bacterium]MBR3260166.1 EamA family transporter [Bacillota bacterium]MBR4024596.1 EamA family transporter [Bacillota bacterium]
MKGIIYAILATISYSSTPTFTQLGYKGGIQTNTLLFSRHLVSLICMLPSFLRKGSFSSLGKKELPWVLLLCFMSVIGNVSFNYAYHYLPNMVAIAISISYVAIVFVIEMFLGREKYSKAKGFILLLSVAGLVVIAIPGFSGSLNMLAFAAGIVGSVQYSIYLVMINSKHLKDVSTEIILLTGVIPIMIYSSVRCFIYGEPLLPSNTLQWIAIICLGTIGVLVARGLFYSAVRLIGATRASMIDTMEPLSSAVLGYILLGQGLDIYTVIGSALMIVSILLLLRQKKNSES